MENLNPYQIAIEQFNRAATKLNLDSDLAEIRTAAYMLAVKRVAEATRVRGLFP